MTLIVLLLRPPPFFLEEYVNLGSNERIQQYDESYCGAYCLYMICLIGRGFGIKSALNVLVNQCKYPGIYNECFCLGCNGNVNDNLNDNDYDNDNDKGKDNDNDSVKENVNDKDNVKDNDNDKVNANVNDNDYDNDNVDVNVNDNDNDNDNFIYQGTCFADLFDEKQQRCKPNNNSHTNNIREAVSPISLNINDDLQSWLIDVDITTEAAFPNNFRCIISVPSECGKTFLLKKLILANIYFDKLYIIGPTGDQNNGLERINPKSIYRIS